MRYILLLIAIIAFSGCVKGFNNQIQAPENKKDKNLVHFNYPDDVEPNRNKHIGPFCCTGKTLIVQGRDEPFGYAYFFGWNGQAMNTGDGFSIFPNAEVLVSGLDDAGDPNSAVTKKTVLIPPVDNLSKKTFSVKAGCLAYNLSNVDAEVTITDNQAKYFKGMPKKLQISVNTHQCENQLKKSQL